MKALSAAVIAVVAVGLPILMGYVLISAARAYQRDSALKNKEMAQRMATELGVEQKTAEYVIRDITIGRSYSFLMDAYLPDYLYWVGTTYPEPFEQVISCSRVSSLCSVEQESLDMLRKLALVGLVLMVGRGSVAQLSCAITLSFGFFALQMYTWPYKIVQDNILRATTEIHVFIVRLLVKPQ